MFRVFKFCFLLRVQLVSKECNHCVNQGMTVLCFARNFIKGLLCCWQWFCLSFWGHPCKIPSTYIGSWCVHGNFSWVQASDVSFMISSVVVCMLRYVSLYSMLPSLYITYFTYFSGFGACWWNSTPLDWFSSHQDAPGPTHHHLITNNFPECIDITTGQGIDLFEIIYAYRFYKLWISLRKAKRHDKQFFEEGPLCLVGQRRLSSSP